MPQWSMRHEVDKEKLSAFMDALGKYALGPGRVYLTGGSTALLLGFRNQTIDIDIKLQPEPKGIFEAISRLKEQLSISVELAAPDDFMPALPDWQGRSEFIRRAGEVEFFHYDFYGQALSKVLRGHTKDMGDAMDLVKAGKVKLDLLLSLFEAVKPDLIRFPAIKSADFERRLLVFIDEASE